MCELEKLRQELAEVDRELMEQFFRRMRIAERVAEYKEKTKGRVYVPRQEAGVLARTLHQAPKELACSAKALARTLMRLSRERQYELLLPDSSWRLGSLLENAQTEAGPLETLAVSADLRDDFLQSLQSLYPDVSLIETDKPGDACRRLGEGLLDGAVLPLSEELIFLLERHALFVQACLPSCSGRYLIVGSGLVWPEAVQGWTLLLRIKGEVSGELLALAVHILSDLELSIVRMNSLSDGSLFLEISAPSKSRMRRVLYQIQQEAGEVHLVGSCPSCL